MTFMSNKMTLRFKQSLYSLDAIKRATIDYDDICKIEIQADSRYVNCLFTDSKVDTRLAIKEFSNYVLELMNEGRA